MNIDVSELKNKKNSKVIINVIIEKDNFFDGNETVKFLEPLKFEGTLHLVNDIFKLNGKPSTELLLTCSRCLKEYSYHLEIDIEENLSTNPSNENCEIISINNDKIDIYEIIENNLAIQLPFKRLCNEYCKGLCQQCGTNLNHEECSCDKMDVDPRLAGLKDLFSNHKEV